MYAQKITKKDNNENVVPLFNKQVHIKILFGSAYWY